MINVGLVGTGFMGMTHYRTYEKVPGIRVAAICEKDPKRRAGDWRDIKGNFGPPGEKMDLSALQTYEELDEMLDNPKIDLVDICLPTALHAPVAQTALKAGKHVFCEKPMALNATDCGKMARAAERAGKLLMIGHVLPFFPEFAHARKIIESGKYGKLLGGEFKRVISDPLWMKNYYNPEVIGGPMLDLHVHDAHFIRLLFGMPTSVTSQGRMRGEVVEFFNSLFRFDDEDLVVSANSGVIYQQGREFTHGFELHLEKATIVYYFAVIAGEPKLLMPLTILDSKGKATPAKLKGGDPTDAFVGEIKEVAGAVKSREPSAILGGELARDAVTLCEKQTRAVRTGKPVKV